MAYELLKVAHIVAVILWFGGMMTVAILLRESPELAASLRIWDQRITTPAMIAAWALGLAMASWGGWFSTGGWLIAKLVFVMALSAVHGMLSGRLRRIAAPRPAPLQAGGLSILAVMTLLLLAIVFLVITKPF